MKFVHIPKTAGISIATTYSDYGWGIFDPSLGCNRPPCCARGGGGRRTNHQHSDKHDVHDPGILRDLYRDEITFCVVRDPIDRLLSEYRYHDHPDDPIALNDTIKQWRSEIARDPHCYMNHLLPQSCFACFCTHVLRYDSLENDLEQLLVQYDIPMRPLKRVNGPSKEYENIVPSAISQENMDWILEYYRDDFRLLSAQR